jgi:oligopeptide transport system substrate-binding protein
VQLPKIEIVMVGDDTELKMFEKEELDWAGSPFGILPVEAILSLKKEHLLQTKEMLGTYFIRVNTDCHPFHDAKLRKAFALAINRQDIVDHVTQGNQIPASGLVPLSLGLQNTPYFQDNAVEEARRLFSDALVRLQLDLKTFPEIKLLYASNERNHLIAQAIEYQWYKAFGIHVKLESCERKVYFDRLSKQDYQLASSSWIADFNDPINFLDVFRYKKGSSNNTLWENAHYAELLQRSAAEANLQERMLLLQQSEKLLIDEMPILPIFYFTMLYVRQPHLKDVVLSSMGVLDFKWAEVRR